MNDRDFREAMPDVNHKSAEVPASELRILMASLHVDLNGKRAQPISQRAEEYLGRVLWPRAVAELQRYCSSSSSPATTPEQLLTTDSGTASIPSATTPVRETADRATRLHPNDPG